MNALRRAGVWLGLVEEVDEGLPDGAFDDEFGDDDFAPPAPRSLARSASRANVRNRQPDRDYRGGPVRDRSGRDVDRHGEREVRIDTRSERVAPDPRDESRFDRELRAVDRDRDDRDRDDRDRDDRDRDDRDRHDRDRTESGSVRHLPRPSAPQSGGLGYPTQDNLALAPQVPATDRATVREEPGARYQITTLHPTKYSDARTIGERFRDGYPVIINLTDLDEPDAKRLVDFAAGLAFGLRGSMERVTNRVFLLSPANIQVSAEDKAKIAEGGFFNQA